MTLSLAMVPWENGDPPSGLRSLRHAFAHLLDLGRVSFTPPPNVVDPKIGRRVWMVHTVMRPT